MRDPRLLPPVAALTPDIDTTKPLDKKPSSAIGHSVHLAVRPAEPEPEDTARNASLIGAGGVLGLCVLGYLASFPLSRASNRGRED